MPELFNQTLKSTLGTSDRIALGVPGQTGCDNILISTFVSLINQEASSVVFGTFTDANLTAGVWEFEHNKNTLYVDLVLINGDGYKEDTTGFRVVDADNISIDLGGTITGTWYYIFKYWL